jgi:hypothetical protein
MDKPASLMAYKETLQIQRLTGSWVNFAPWRSIYVPQRQIANAVVKLLMNDLSCHNERVLIG